jgi:hypothetical protein
LEIDPAAISLPLGKNLSPDSPTPIRPASPLDAVFSLVADRLSACGVNCLLVGGFAVNYYGYTRNTLDVDFMVATDDRPVVHSVFVAAGFLNVTVSDNAVFFESPASPLRVDFLLVDAGTMRGLMANATAVRLRDSCVSVPSLKDLLAMKLFALAHAGNRRMDKDMPDVAHLSVIHQLDLEADLHPLCREFATEEIFEQISARVRELRSC